jgi:hypothetical protein
MSLQSKIQLEIETGAGNYALADTCPAISANFSPLLDIAFGTPFLLGDFQNLQASDAISRLDGAIYSLHADRIAYAGLSEIQQGLRPQVLAYLNQWRELCRKHPKCQLAIVP